VQILVSVARANFAISPQKMRSVKTKLCLAASQLALALCVVLLDCQNSLVHCMYDSRTICAAPPVNQEGTAPARNLCHFKSHTLSLEHTLAELQLQKHDLTMHSLAQNTQPLENPDTIAS